MSVTIIDKHTNLPIGLSDDVKANELDPESVELDLGSGEQVIVKYDVYYPGKMLPFWKWLLYVICTFGLYIVYIELLKFCYKNCSCCCKPSRVEMERGRMAITNRGRILIWKTDVLQQRTGSCCCVTAEYNSTTLSRQYNLKDVAEVAFKCNRRAPILCGIGPCVETYNARIRLSIDKFDLTNDIAMPTKNGISAASNFFAFLYRTEQLAFVDIVSAREDENMFDLEHKKAIDSVSAMTIVHKQIIELVSASKEDTFEPVSVDLKSVLKQPNFINTTDEWNNPSWVTPKNLTVPRNLAAIDEAAEPVFGAETFIYSRTFLDLILSILTCGMYWMFVVAPKLQNRPSGMFTSKRFIEFTILKGDFLIPCLPCCVLASGVRIRSFFPSKVTHGRITRERYSVSSSLCTSNGVININFGQARDTTLGNVIARNVDVVHSKVAFIEALFQSVITNPLGDAESLGVDNLGPLQDIELNLYRPHDAEYVLARYDSKVYSPWCGCDNSMLLFPRVWLCMTCGIRPYLADQAMTLTNHSVLVYKKFGNSPWCGPLSCFCRQVASELFWAPIENFRTAECSTFLKGRDNCIVNCCDGNFFGALCCPKQASSLKLSTMVSTSSEKSPAAFIEDMKKRGSIRKEEKVNKIRRSLSNVQLILHGSPVDASAVPMDVSAVPVGVSAVSVENSYPVPGVETADHKNLL